MTKKQIKNVSKTHPLVTVDRGAPKPTGLFKMKSTPRGNALFVYTVAAFMALDLWNSRKKIFQKEDLTQFFRTDKVFTYHRDAGDFEETKNGARMTRAGWEYFNGRLNGSTIGQKVHKPDAEVVAAAMKSGTLSRATERFPKNTPFVAITK